MAALPADAQAAWNNRESRMVFSTIDASNTPNSIWILCAKFVDDDKIVVANNAMGKTLENIKNGSKASLLYIAPEREAYQIKGRVEHHSDGPIYDDMKSWLNPKYPGTSAILLHIDEVFYGASKVA